MQQFIQFLRYSECKIGQLTQMYGYKGKENKYFQTTTNLNYVVLEVNDILFSCISP